MVKSLLQTSEKNTVVARREEKQRKKEKLLTVDVQVDNLGGGRRQVRVGRLAYQTGIQMLPADFWEVQMVHHETVGTYFVRVVYHRVLEVPRDSRPRTSCNHKTTAINLLFKLLLWPNNTSIINIGGKVLYCVERILEHIFND